MEAKHITKLVLQQGDTTTTWSIPYSDASLGDILDGFYGCLIGQTFLPETVVQGFREWVEEHTPEEPENPEE